MSAGRYLWLGIFVWLIVQSIFLVWKTSSEHEGYSKLRKKYFSRLLLFGAITIRVFLPAALRGDAQHQDAQLIWSYVILLPLAVTWLHFDNVFILYSTAYTWCQLRREATLMMASAGIAIAYRVVKVVSRLRRRSQ